MTYTDRLGVPAEVRMSWSLETLRAVLMKATPIPGYSSVEWRRDIFGTLQAASPTVTVTHFPNRRKARSIVAAANRSPTGQPCR